MLQGSKRKSKRTFKRFETNRKARRKDGHASHSSYEQQQTQLRVQSMAVNSYIKREERFQISNSRGGVPMKNKGEPKVRRKEIETIRADGIRRGEERGREEQGRS